MKQELVLYLKALRDNICDAFAQYEPIAKFACTPWDYREKGGGEISVIRGEVFEKAAVNWSGVEGETFPMGNAQGPFFATGVSLITHMKNPHVPTVHMNIRFIQVGERWWLGGGYDLTPMGFPYEEDTQHFHRVAQKALAPWNLYSEFSLAAKKYFTIPHYGCERGVGGVFFDHFNTGDPAADLAMWKAVGESLTEAYLPIIEKRMKTPYGEAEKLMQLKARSRYVEFNLLYDRGTKFGFQSGGNPEAILCSMPPLAAW